MTESSPEALLAAGNPQAALEALQARVRERSADPKLRVFLFQLLCVLGQWQRALNQLEVCGELDAATLPMVNTYREALKCEAVREAVFAGKTTPMIFGRPQPWIASLVEALQADSRGEPGLGVREAAPAVFVGQQLEVRLQLLAELVLPAAAGHRTQQPRDPHAQGGHDSGSSIRAIMSTVRAHRADSAASCFWPALVML